MAEFWETQGLRSWLQGFLWLTDPHDYDEVLRAWGLEPESAAVVVRTGMGDLVLWQYDAVYLVNHRNRSVMPIESDLLLFLNFYLSDADFRVRVLASELFQKTSERLPPPGVDQCYGYVPLPELGGSGEPATLALVPLIPHLLLLAQLGT